MKAHQRVACVLFATGMSLASATVSAEVLGPGYTLAPDQRLYSLDHKYFAALGGDGDFGVYRTADGARTWSTGTRGSGAIRATLTAVPRRLPVLWAKTLVLVAAAAPVMIASCVAAVYVAQAATPASARIGLGDGTLLRATLDGHVVAVGATLERGHPVFLVPVLLHPGVSRTIVLNLSEPTAPGAATTRVQPLARPQVTDFDVPRCG